MLMQIVGVKLVGAARGGAKGKGRILLPACSRAITTHPPNPFGGPHEPQVC